MKKYLLFEKMRVQFNQITSEGGIYDESRFVVEMYGFSYHKGG